MISMRHLSLSLSLFFLFLSRLSALNQDGVLLLTFKYAVISDPSNSLSDWNYLDDSPCPWNGVMCMGFPLSNTTSGATSTGTDTGTVSRVISVVLPNLKLVGTLVPELGLIEHLRHLDLSGNSLNGTIPSTFFNATELRILSLAGNSISGAIPVSVPGTLTDLQMLNLSENALVGTVPTGIALLPNLTILSLSNNYLSGELPDKGFNSVEALDLSSNLINGSIPDNFGSKNLKFLNLSSNRLMGQIPPQLGLDLLPNATIDLSFNNLTGQIPQASVFLNQKACSFTGNEALCGKPMLEKPCSIPSTLSNPPNGTESESPPAIAVMPKDAPGDNSEDTSGDALGTRSEASGSKGGLRPMVILAIAVGDVAGIAILFLVFLYVYQVKKRKRVREDQQVEKNVVINGNNRNNNGGFGGLKVEREVDEGKQARAKGFSCCVRNKTGDGEEESDEASESSVSSGTDEIESRKREKEDINGKSPQNATLVTVDGETELEMETLLKASAYILGATGSSIVYKAVLSDGTALAVRRIGESSCVERFKEFDAQVRVLAKFKHPNLLRVRGFYWGTDEKLLIHEYAVNGSLANISFNKKLGSSPFHMSWDMRLRILRGTARGLSYLHEKKCVHGNIKPSNILLNSDFEPLIADFGLENLITGDPITGIKPGSSARLFGSKRSMHSTSSLPDLSIMPGASPNGSIAGSIMGAQLIPYHAPESLKNLKMNNKWDVYSFGVVLLELIAGRVLSEVELCQWNGGFMAEERTRVLRMGDPALRSEIEGKEEMVLSCFKLGFSCCAVSPHKRPSMKEVVQVLERISNNTNACSSSSPSPLNYG